MMIRNLGLALVITLLIFNLHPPANAQEWLKELTQALQKEDCVGAEKITGRENRMFANQCQFLSFNIMAQVQEIEKFSNCYKLGIKLCNQGLECSEKAKKEFKDFFGKEFLDSKTKFQKELEKQKK